MVARARHVSALPRNFPVRFLEPPAPPHRAWPPELLLLALRRRLAHPPIAGGRIPARPSSLLLVGKQAGTRRTIGPPTRESLARIACSCSRSCHLSSPSRSVEKHSEITFKGKVATKPEPNNEKIVAGDYHHKHGPRILPVSLGSLFVGILRAARLCADRIVKLPAYPGESSTQTAYLACTDAITPPSVPESCSFLYLFD